MILEIKLGVVALCIILKIIGELWWHNAQRFILPIIYSIAVSYISHCWWLGFTTLPMIVMISFGYKRYGRTDSVARAWWLFMICIVSGLGPLICGHLSWFFYVPYFVLAGFIGTLTRNINNLIEAPLCGLWIGLPILFIH